MAPCIQRGAACRLGQISSGQREVIGRDREAKSACVLQGHRQQGGQHRERSKQTKQTPRHPRMRHPPRPKNPSPAQQTTQTRRPPSTHPHPHTHIRTNPTAHSLVHTHQEPMCILMIPGPYLEVQSTGLLQQAQNSNASWTINKRRKVLRWCCVHAIAM